MTRTQRLRSMVVITLLATLTSIALLVFAYRRATTLNELRLQSDSTLQVLYRLSNRTYELLYSASDLSEARDAWQAELDAAQERVEELPFHPALGLLSREIQQRIRQTSTLWSYTTSGFVSGGRLMDELMEESSRIEAEGVVVDNFASILDQIREASTSEGAENPLQDLSFAVQRSYMEIDGTNEQLWFFTTSAFEGFGNDIQIEVDRVTRLTIVLSSLIAAVLITLVLVLLLTSVNYLQTAAEHLEENVRERTHAIQSLLDSSGEGFFSFGTDLIVRTEVSRECEAIFGRAIVGERAPDLLFHDPQKRTDFEYAMDLVFSGRSDPDVVFDVLDDQIQLEEKIAEVVFRLVDESTVLCILRDVTVQRQLESEFDEERENREMILRVVTARSFFLNLVEEASHLFHTLESYMVNGAYVADADQTAEMMRELHTFKSNCGFLRMRSSAETAHGLEDKLAEYELLGEPSDLGFAIRDFRRAYESEIESVTGALGRDWLDRSGTYEVDGEELEFVLSEAKRLHGPDSPIANAVDRLASVSLRDLFTRMSDYATQLAKGRGKQITTTTDDTDIRIPRELHAALSDILTHLIRNMVDHGIELPGRREKAGKKPDGTIRLSARSADSTLTIVVSDDGAGINPSRVRKRAVQRGLVAADQTLSTPELIRLVFTDGFSTTDSVTAVSGRGIGLSAVRETVRAQNGRIHLKTRTGRGTEITLEFPIARPVRSTG